MSGRWSTEIENLYSLRLADDVRAWLDEQVWHESGGAELEQLGRSINSMLASLSELREHERRLIDDAAHELRTPLTSLRTNIELLSSGRTLSTKDREELLAPLMQAIA